MSRVVVGVSAQTQPQAARPRASQHLKHAWSLARHASHTLLAAWAKKRRVRRAVRQLEALSDRMLADIGLDRSDIPRAARCGREDAAARSILFASFEG